MQSLTGTWQMIHTECVGNNGETLPAPYAGDQGMGLVSFHANGRMICVLCDSRPEVPADTTREYNSYCGNFRFDGQQLITRVDSSSNPDWVGTDQVRDVAFEGDTLILKPVRFNGGLSVGQRILHWKQFPAIQ